jgi:hypothetical protein
MIIKIGNSIKTRFGSENYDRENLPGRTSVWGDLQRFSGKYLQFPRKRSLQDDLILPVPKILSELFQKT